VVGVDRGSFDLPAPKAVAKPRVAASAKLALERSLKVAVERKDRELDTRHLLLALLRAEAGTVPRLLAAEGIDRDELAARLEGARAW
jgi:ATP-dependent Clp protease ATP-binding subunit ClpA